MTDPVEVEGGVAVQGWDPCPGPGEGEGRGTGAAPRPCPRPPQAPAHPKPGTRVAPLAPDLDHALDRIC